MTAQTNLYIQHSSPAAQKRQRARRRHELLNTVLEGLATLGIGASFIVCAILFLCII